MTTINAMRSIMKSFINARQERIFHMWTKELPTCLVATSNIFLVWFLWLSSSTLSLIPEPESTFELLKCQWKYFPICQQHWTHYSSKYWGKKQCYVSDGRLLLVWCWNWKVIGSFEVEMRGSLLETKYFICLYSDFVYNFRYVKLI